MRNPILEPIVEENSNLSEEAIFQVYNQHYVKKNYLNYQSLQGHRLHIKDVFYFLFLLLLL